MHYQNIVDCLDCVNNPVSLLEAEVETESRLPQETLQTLCGIELMNLISDALQLPTVNVAHALLGYDIRNLSATQIESDPGPIYPRTCLHMIVRGTIFSESDLANGPLTSLYLKVLWQLASWEVSRAPLLTLLRMHQLLPQLLRQIDIGRNKEGMTYFIVL